MHGNVGKNTITFQESGETKACLICSLQYKHIRVWAILFTDSTTMTKDHIFHSDNETVLELEGKNHKTLN